MTSNLSSTIVNNSGLAINCNIRAAQGSAGCVIVVEGFFDCLRVHQAGYHNVVALMGVSLSEMQQQVLLERFQQLVLMLDGDEERTQFVSRHGTAIEQQGWLPSGQRRDIRLFQAP